MIIARSSLSWDVRQRRLVVIFRRFGTTYRAIFSISSRMGYVGCTETSVT